MLANQRNIREAEKQYAERERKDSLSFIQMSNPQTLRKDNPEQSSNQDLKYKYSVMDQEMRDVANKQSEHHMLRIKQRERLHGTTPLQDHSNYGGKQGSSPLKTTLYLQRLNRL